MVVLANSGGGYRHGEGRRGPKGRPATQRGMIVYPFSQRQRQRHRFQDDDDEEEEGVEGWGGGRRRGRGEYEAPPFRGRRRGREW